MDTIHNSSTDSKDNFEYITTVTASRILGITTQAVRDRIRKGTLPGRRLDRWFLIPANALKGVIQDKKKYSNDLA